MTLSKTPPPMRKRYQIIYADPPWKYYNQTFGGRIGKSPLSRYSVDLRYPSMKLKDIKALPIKSIMDKNCILFLWVTNPMLPDGIEVIKSWGFKYKTVGFCWIKTTKTGKLRTNLGYWTLGGMELCLIGTKGSPKKQRNNIRQILHDEVIRHSQKPEEVRNRIGQLMGNISRIELFAREKTSGWDVWGNEVKSDIVL